MESGESGRPQGAEKVAWQGFRGNQGVPDRPAMVWSAILQVSPGLGLWYSR